MYNFTTQVFWRHRKNTYIIKIISVTTIVIKGNESLLQNFSKSKLNET